MALRLVRLAGLVLVVVGLYWMVLSALQKQILFPGTAYEGANIPDERLSKAGIERWWFSIEDGEVEAWWMPAPTTKGAIIFAHGNGELIEMWPEPLSAFHRFGLGVLLVEFPGYGRSTGEPGIETIRDVFLQGYDRLVEDSGIDADRVIGFGRSLGGGAIAELARHRELGGMIFASTFTSVRAMARKFLLPGMLVRDDFDVLGAVERFDGPVLVVHGTRDEIIPFSHGQELASAKDDATLVAYDAGHNDCPPNWQKFYEDVGSWLQSHGLAGDQASE